MSCSSHHAGISESSLGPSPGLTSTVNTPSPSSFDSKSQTNVPWTGLSLIVAVSWMLFLAFSPLAPVNPPTLEQDTARIYEPVGLALLTGIFVATRQTPSTSWSWYAELAPNDLDADE